MTFKSKKSAYGFSLVELMVGMTIGLITVLVVGQVFSLSETRKRAATSGSDAVIDGSLALYTLERDGKNAGYGMTTVRSSVGCEIRATFNGVALPPINLSPVTLTDGAAGAPDTVRFMASSKNGITLPTKIAVDHPPTAANFFVESDVGIQSGDLMIAVPAVLSTTVPATTWCTVFMATGTGGAGGGGAGGGGAQGQNQVLHNSGQSDWNQPGGSNIFPAAGYSTDDYVINLGSFADHTYSINANFLRLTELIVATNTSSTQDLFPHMVQLQAVYGKDTNADNIVDAWNATAPTTAVEWQQIRAVRVAVVARSQYSQGQVVTLDGAATASTCASATPHPAAVCWKPDPNGNGVKIDVSSGNTSWQNYSYRVFETTIPLRNAIWQQ